MKTPQCTRAWAQAGFTLLELAFVMLVVGIVTSSLVPMVSDLHHRSLADEDRRILKTVKEAIIGQFLATGALPPCLSAAGVDSPTGNCDTARSLAGLPVRVADNRNTLIRYDAWNVAASNLTSAGASPSTKATACARLDTAIAAAYAAGQPAQCSTAPDNQNSATWPTYCATAQNIAFVLVATGVNRATQSNETVASSAARLGNRNIGTDRVFERPERRANPDFYYDDQVEVVTLQELKAKCPL